MRFLCTTAYLEATNNAVMYSGIDLDTFEIISGISDINQSINKPSRDKLTLVKLMNGQVVKTFNDKQLWYVAKDSDGNAICLDGVNRFVHLQIHHVGLLENAGYTFNNCKKKDEGTFLFNGQRVKMYRLYPSKNGTCTTFEKLTEMDINEMSCAEHLLINNWTLALVMGIINAYTVFRLPMRTYKEETVKNYLAEIVNIRNTAAILNANRRAIKVCNQRGNNNCLAVQLFYWFMSNTHFLISGYTVDKPELVDNKYIYGRENVFVGCSAGGIAVSNERVLCVSMKTPSYQSKFTLENPVITAEDNLIVITGKQSAVLPGTPGFNVKLKMLNDYSDWVVQMEPVESNRYLGSAVDMKCIWDDTCNPALECWRNADAFDMFDLQNNKLKYCVNRGLDEYIRFILQKSEQREISAEAFVEMLKFYKLNDKYFERKPRLRPEEKVIRLSRYDFALYRETYNEVGRINGSPNPAWGGEYTIYRNGIEYKKFLAFSPKCLNTLDRYSPYKSVSKLYIEIAKKAYNQLMDTGWITVDDFWWGQDYLAIPEIEKLVRDDFYDIRMDILTGIYYIVYKVSAVTADSAQGAQYRENPLYDISQNGRCATISGESQFDGYIYKKIFAFKDYKKAQDIFKILAETDADEFDTIEEIANGLYRDYCLGKRKEKLEDKAKLVQQLSGLNSIVGAGLIGVHVKDINAIDKLHKVGLIGG